MLKYIHRAIVLAFPILFSGSMYAQQRAIDLTLEQSVGIMRKENKTLKIAGKEIELARNEHQKLNSFWYPMINASGAYVHLSNKIEVKEPLNQFTDPAKDFVHSIIPNDQVISSILDKIGTYSLTFPLMPQDLTTIDANITWPVFTGGKRIYAGKIGRSMISIAEVGKEQVDANLQSLLVETYYALRLGQKVVQVREETYGGLKKHYENALKLEANGIINKAERLFAQVSMDEAKRELETARKDLNVAQNALRSLLDIESQDVVNPTTPLFINENIPSEAYFKSLVVGNSYVINQLRLQENIASNQLKIGRTGYVPNIALFGKQTIFSHGTPKNLLPRTVVGVGFTWNIFDGLNREKNIRQAKLTKQSLELGKEKATNDLQVGVDKLYSQLQNSLDNVTALNTTIELSRELLRMRKKSFQEGMATSTDVIDAEIMLSKVQIAYLMAFYQYDVSLVNLLSTCGVPDSFWEYSKNGKTEHFIFE